MIDVSKTDLTKVYNLSNRILDYYKKNLEDMKINASGQLSRTADFDIEFSDYHLAVYFILESYYTYVERGRNKSTGKFSTWSSKVTDIEQWLRQKIARGSFVPTSGHTIPHTDKEIKSVSYLIARKITRVGFYGRTHYGKHPLEEAIKQAEAAGIIDEIIDCVVDGFAGAVDIEIEKL
jgi:hypothetical protein